MHRVTASRVILPLLAALTVAGYTPAASAAVEEVAVETLKPGQYRWDPSSAAKGPLRVVVSIPEQVAYVYRAETLIGVSTVSTGMPGYDTPVGEYTILQKKVDHRSNLYDDAPMPFMQRLTWDGVALHAGRIPGHPASHGCVRLPRAFAKLLYGATALGASVTITDQYVGGGVAPEPVYETDMTAAETSDLLRPISVTIP